MWQSDAVASPSDPAIVGDDDGVVVVARAVVADVIDWAEDHEKSEEHIKELIRRENVAPGKYYNPETFERLSHERQKRRDPS